MLEKKSEAKETVEETSETTQTEESTEKVVDKSVDEKMDDVLDEKFGKENPEATSTSKETTDDETKTEAEGDSDPDTAKKESEAKEETDKSEEDDVPKEFHKHPKWQKLYNRAIDAEAKLEEKGAVVDESTQAALDEFKNFSSTREFLEAKLKKDGLRDEVIAERLKEAGFESAEATAQSDLEIAAEALNLDVKSLTDQERADISGIGKVSRALMMNDLKKILPELINPISDKVSALTAKDSGLKIHDDFTGLVEKDAVLDYVKDLAPDISKFLDDNPNSTQQDVEKFQNDLYHNKLVLHKTALAGKEEREEKLSDNRPGGEGTRTATGLPDKTGDFDKDADALFDHLGVH